MSASLCALYLAVPKVRTVAQKHSCRGLGRDKSGRVICRDGVLYHFSKICKSLTGWNKSCNTHSVFGGNLLDLDGRYSLL